MRIRCSTALFWKGQAKMIIKVHQANDHNYFLNGTKWCVIHDFGCAKCSYPYTIKPKTSKN
jgi:hypothetical protein